MSKYKLVAADLDDTLLDDNFRLTGRVKEMIKAVLEAGVQFTLSTGRMYRSAEPYARELGLDTPLITYQGALVKNALSGEVLFYRPLPLRYAREIIGRVHELGYHLNAYLDDLLLMEQDTPEGRRYMQIAGVQAEIVGDLLKILDSDPTKVVVIADEALLDQLSAELAPIYHNKVHISKSKPYFLEFSHPQATKGYALAMLAEYYGINRDKIIAIGDSYNDLEMLEYAGLGVVVANAREEIKEKAGYVATAPNGEGVVEALEKFVLRR
ncbi:MAG: Cof-type HAD-IIB family hydrolase [Desulfotomaculaceae bacterium]|nr:Cof-type HAD-IIB family hydrolase [Desulfotomaculaceae bacterium]